MLSFTFSEQENLTIKSPGIIEVFTNRIEIMTAENVHWEWFDYGKEKSIKYLYYYDFSRIGNKIIGKSNIHWSAVNNNELSISKPAVLLVKL